MIDSYSDIVLRAGDATPKDIVLRPSPSPRNPQNRYPEASEVKTGVMFGPGQLYWQEYETGTYAGGGGGGLSARVIGSLVVRRISL